MISDRQDCLSDMLAAFIYMLVYSSYGVSDTVFLYLVQKCGKPKNKFLHRYCTSCKYSAHVFIVLGQRRPTAGKA